MGGGGDSVRARQVRTAIVLGSVAAGVLVVLAFADGDSAPPSETEIRAETDIRTAAAIETDISRDEAGPGPKESSWAGKESDGAGTTDSISRPSEHSAPPEDGWTPTYNDEALPCTGPKQPVNFQTLSAGSSVNGLPLTYTERRCGGGAPAVRTNYLSYIYGDCEIAEGATGCQPPLEIQNWPACQRFLAKYSFRGEPPPHRELARQDGAEVVEFNFGIDKRLEVYTETTTVVIFATERRLAVEAVEMLRNEDKGQPPATHPDELEDQDSGWLGPPANGSMEGDLQCDA
jgi:hypothetical protein